MNRFILARSLLKVCLNQLRISDFLMCLRKEVSGEKGQWEAQLRCLNVVLEPVALASSRNCWKHTFSGSTLDLLSRKCWSRAQQAVF